MAEGVCRFLNIGSSSRAVYKDDPAEGEIYAYKPNGKLLYHYPDNPRGYFSEENEVSGTINAKGFRGPDKAFEKTNGTVRIAFLGDSFTLGVGVKDNDTLPASFEHVIKSKYPNTEVLNFGISASSTIRQIKLIEEYVIKFEPDIVVIVLFLNDANLMGTYNFLSRPKVLARVRKYSFFINAFVGRSEKYFLHKKMIRYYKDSYIEGSSGWEAVKTALRKGQSLSEKNDFQFIVALYPILFQLDDRHSFRNIHRIIEDYCASLKIPFVDLLNGFIGKKHSELWVHPVDHHPNEVAHRIAGAELSDFFNSKDLIKK
jgi:lysophospholipase L1-like esterase